MRTAAGPSVHDPGADRIVDYCSLRILHRVDACPVRQSEAQRRRLRQSLPKDPSFHRTSSRQAGPQLWTSLNGCRAVSSTRTAQIKAVCLVRRPGCCCRSAARHEIPDRRRTNSSAYIPAVAPAVAVKPKSSQCVFAQSRSAAVFLLRWMPYVR